VVSPILRIGHVMPATKAPIDISYYWSILY
jgi:hypothetical protein